jgi:branched-chain amino acid transport system permease protein
MFAQIGQAVVAGIGVGGIYGMLAMGYTLILAGSGVFNFALGSVVMGGTLSLYGLWEITGIPFLLSLAILCTGGLVVGIVTYFLAVRPVEGRRGVRNLTEGTLVTTFGLGLLLNTIAGNIFGYDTIPVRSYVSLSAFRVFGIAVSYLYIVMIGVTVVVALGIDTFLRRTQVGIALRATVDDGPGASLMGVRVSRMILTCFGIAGALAALSGALLSPITFASVDAGSSLVFYGFAAMAIGGFGSFIGALAGGIVIGLISTVTPIWVNPNYAVLIIYGFLVLLLVIRPTGFFGTAGRFGAASLREV